MAVPVELVDLGHHALEEADGDVAVGEVVGEEVCGLPEGEELVGHHEGFVAWLHPVPAELGVQVLHQREVRLQHVVHLLHPQLLQAELLRVVALRQAQVHLLELLDRLLLRALLVPP